ncbi:unnamed protein product [Rhizoctonia solani]|uniref:Uncharacterized protein n=1 Tax=Rhizoctonia solani TaxID=456999 RepID=A0A8H2WK52_9AGAM|nr:unnamed protein product [Rhizoctonia solani]
MSQSDKESRQHLNRLSDNFFKSPDGRAGAKRPRERSISPILGDTMNLAGVRGLESEEPLLNFSDLIRPLSATPSPEPSLPSDTPPREEQTRETSFPSELFNGKYLGHRILPSGEEEGDELMDDARVAEVRRMVIAWGVHSREPGLEQTSSGRERQLAMMVMALTHPARPTASQVAAQAEHIRSLLAERSVMIQQLEDLSEFRHADRMSFERTAQALSARAAQRNAKCIGYSLTPREAFYEDERSRTMDSHALQEKLVAENSKLEHDLQEARREVAVLKQSIEDLRLDILIRPHSIPSTLTASQSEPVVPPTPNPRGRPRKYPLPSPASSQGFQAPTHSNPGAQLPTSSSTILSISSGSTQPPPEKRMRGAQPDARAELLIAAARRVGKERVLKVLEISDAGNTTGREEPKPLENLVSPFQPTQARIPFLQHSPSELPVLYSESSPTNGIDHTVTRRGRPPRASISFPATAHHQFTQFLVDDDSGRPISGRGRSSKLRATKSAQEAGRNPLDSSLMGEFRGTIPPVQAIQTPRRAQAQQVVVPFTGDPQVDAQTCLASFVAQYPGIQTTPVRNTSKAEAMSGLEGALESHLPHGDSSMSTGTAGQYLPDSAIQVTPDRNTNDTRSHGLEHLLSAARTMLRARSQSTSPTPQRQLTSNSALASPHHISPRKRHSPSLPHSNSIVPASPHSSPPLVQLGDSDTEPDEPESQGRRRVYSALDVLADQAAAARTSPSELLVGRPASTSTSSPERLHPFHPLASFPVTPEPHAALFAPRARNATLSSPMTIIPASDPPQLSSSSTSPSTLGTVDNHNQRRAMSDEPTEQMREHVPESSQYDANMGLGGTASITNSVSKATLWASSHAEPTPMSDAKVTHPENLPYTPPRSEKSRGKQRA